MITTVIFRLKIYAKISAGPLSWLNGNSFIRYFINDNIRVVDYHCTRDEIDIERIGYTGTSGGGNTTLFHATLDDRVRCAVSVCTVASFTDYIIMKYSGGCPEYYPAGLLGYGIDIQDIICLIAPRAFMSIGGGFDVIKSTSSLKKLLTMQRKCMAFIITIYMNKSFLYFIPIDYL